MSPEQAEGELDRLGPRSDVYSLGATLYCLLTGKPPFEGEGIDVILRRAAGRVPPPRQLDPAHRPGAGGGLPEGHGHRPEDRYATAGRWPTTWIAGWPTSRSRPGASRSARRARRWARRNRTAVTAAAVALVAGVVGLSAVLAVQTRAKADLAASLAARQRQNGAGRDQRRADPLAGRRPGPVRPGRRGDQDVSHRRQRRLPAQAGAVQGRPRPALKSASDFYGKLGALLGKESDLASRRALWQANYEVAELTGKVGKPEDALAAHRQVLAAREALAAGSQADPEIKADVGRSLTAVAGLLETTGQTEEAEATYRKAETLLVELAPTIAEAAAARAVLANCRSSLGWLLHTTGRDDEALSVYRLARADQEALAAAPGATAESRRDLAAHDQQGRHLLAATGKSSEAEAEFRKALAIEQKLADDNPAVTDFRSHLASSHNNLGNLLSSTGKSSEAEAEYRKALAIQQKLADDNPAVTDFRSHLARSHNGLGCLLSDTGKSSEAEAEYRKALASSRSWRRQPRRHPIPQQPGTQPRQLGSCCQTGKSSEAEPSTARRCVRRSWPTTTRILSSEESGGQPARHRLAARAGRKNGRGDRLLHAGRGDPTEARRGQLGNPRRQGLPGELPDQHGGRASSVGEA